MPRLIEVKGNAGQAGERIGDRFTDISHGGKTGGEGNTEQAERIACHGVVLSMLGFFQQKTRRISRAGVGSDDSLKME